MQNLLPLLALRPSHVIQICSAGERFTVAARSIETASSEAGVEAKFHSHTLASDCPDVTEVKEALKQLLADAPDAVINLTGGTKLMSIGAFLAADQHATVPILYCDTDRSEFVSIGRAPLPEMPSFGEIASRLTLRIVMAAHGKAPDTWRFDSVSPAASEFGRRSFDLRWNHRKQFDDCQFSRRTRDFFRSDRGRIPSGTGRLTALCEANLLDALPDPVPSAVQDFCRAAGGAGFLAPLENGGWRIAPVAEGQSLRSHVETIANILDGSWLELTVLNLVQRSHLFADAHWSVEPLRNPGGEDNRSFGETDVVCLGLPKGNLHVISCKTKLEKPLEHLEALHERSQNLGGRFARAVLAVLFTRPEQVVELRRWERLLNVTVLMGDEIFQKFAVSGEGAGNPQRSP